MPPVPSEPPACHQYPVSPSQCALAARSAAAVSVCADRGARAQSDLGRGAWPCVRRLPSDRERRTDRCAPRPAPPPRRSPLLATDHSYTHVQLYTTQSVLQSHADTDPAITTITVCRQHCNHSTQTELQSQHADRTAIIVAAGLFDIIRTSNETLHASRPKLIVKASQR